MCVILKSLVVQADLEKLKCDASLTLNEACFGQLADAAEGGEGRAVAFLQVEFRTCLDISATHVLFCRVFSDAHSAWLLCIHSEEDFLSSMIYQTFGASFELN